MRRTALLLLFGFAVSVGLAQDTLKPQDTLKVVQAVRTRIAPKIDGILEDEVWKNIPASTDFIQWDPDYKAPSSQKTEVKIIYDDDAIYIGAFMYDTHPDSILHELGNRDDQGLNSDYFFVGIDTYNKHIDAYYFGVSASGVQMDVTIADQTFDGVWLSGVKLNDKGWCAEFRIPYSAIRFPVTPNHDWRIQFQRTIRRNRELSRCPFYPKEDPTYLKYFAHLQGLTDIKAPTRLVLIPYLTVAGENSPDYNADGSYNSNSAALSYSLGADIKYGINDRFTLDATLLPDFSQVQSDNKVKNLSYREITYQENRPFFKEGIDLFTKMNLFYTRRVGLLPILHDSLQANLKKGEVLEDNPYQARLLNCIKLTGRTDHGLGIGFFNAITENTYGTVRDSLGNHHQVLTQPFTNYNILVLDQQLKNSSSITLINTNVLRDKGWMNANVTGLGFTLLNKKNTIKITSEEALSEHFKQDSTGSKLNTLSGYKYSLWLEKIGGNFTYGMRHGGYSPTYDQQDLGFYLVTNQRSTFTYLTYDQFVANKTFRNAELSGNNQYATNFVTGERTSNLFDLNGYCMLLNYLVFFFDAGVSPTHNLDYFEPRVPGYVFMQRRYYNGNVGVSTDYRKRFAVDFKIIGAQYLNESISGIYTEADLGLRFRVNDRVSLFYNGTISRDNYNQGFAALDTNGAPVMGGRVLNTVVNSIQARYIFSPTMSLNLNVRHYWNTGKYLQYFTLNNDGTLKPYDSYKTVNDFNYNIFNIDLVYTWIFSPGSTLSVIYKNAIEQNTLTTSIPRYYDEDFNGTMMSPQTNSLSVKLLYYLDYQDVKKAQRNKGLH
jgi:hypothetical protein